MNMWRKFEDEAPAKLTPVLMYRPGFFPYLYNVCVYDGVSRWRIYCLSYKFWMLPVRRGDFWIYIDNCVPAPAVDEF
jgi:hypothetical protein